MVTRRFSSHTCDFCPDSRQIDCSLFWYELQSWLKPYVIRWIYECNLPVWLGQEQDITEDVLQETWIRILNYMHRDEAHSIQQIESLESFCITVAHNYVRDLRRKQYRLIRFTSLSTNLEDALLDLPDSEDPLEVALAHLMSRDTLVKLAHIIAGFPQGQKRAILIDLAQRSDFDEESGPLHIIFLDLGIDLHKYSDQYPLNAIERSRHASLLSIAYKRLRQTFYAQTGQLVA